jgi:hypothetical protein
MLHWHIGLYSEYKKVVILRGEYGGGLVGLSPNNTEVSSQKMSTLAPQNSTVHKCSGFLHTFNTLCQGCSLGLERLCLETYFRTSRLVFES